MSRPARILLVAAAALVLVVLLFTAVFPWLSRVLLDDPTLGPAPAQTRA